VLVPYSKYQLVDWPLGLTVPLAVADVVLTALTGPLIAVGAARTAAPPALPAKSTRAASRKDVPRSLPGLRVLICTSPYNPAAVNNVLGKRKDSVLAADELEDAAAGALDRAR
jgi:hypothetical protein